MWGRADCCRQVIGVFSKVQRGGEWKERRRTLRWLAQSEMKPDIWKWTAIYVHPVVSQCRKRFNGLETSLMTSGNCIMCAAQNNNSYRSGPCSVSFRGFIYCNSHKKKRKSSDFYSTHTTPISYSSQQGQLGPLPNKCYCSWTTVAFFFLLSF